MSPPCHNLCINSQPQVQGFWEFVVRTVLDPCLQCWMTRKKEGNKWKLLIVAGIGQIVYPENCIRYTRTILIPEGLLESERTFSFSYLTCLNNIRIQWHDRNFSFSWKVSQDKMFSSTLEYAWLILTLKDDIQ